MKRLLDMTKAAMDSGVNHTPTFLINGNVTDAATWEQLEPLIQKAAGRG
jgi:protein-disulfide isomerase